MSIAPAQPNEKIEETVVDVIRSSSNLSNPVDTSQCIRDSHRCHWNGSLGYCCSGHCIQDAGEAHNYCGVTTPATSASPLTPSTEITTTSLPGCLPEGAACRSDGTSGTCCSFNCFQLREQPFGQCIGGQPPTDIPDKCLENDADCTASGSLGFCCSGLCRVIAPHTIGTCGPKEATNETRQAENHSWIIYTSITLSLVIVMILGFLWLYFRQKKMEKGLSKVDTDLFFYGDPESVHVNGYAHENVDQLPYKKEFEIPETDFSVDMQSQLGSGCYGLVLKGKVRGEEVAVKTIRSSLNSGTHLRSLLSEIKTLQYIGPFENVVSLVGCSTSNLATGKVFLFLEYCPLGSLESFLRKNKYKYTDLETTGGSIGEYQNSSEFNHENVLDPKKLMQWSLQITNAMKFLAAKKVIHADLATRNVLLLNPACAKLTDFGLSRRLYEYGNYVKKHQEPLPWRWMALESLSQLSFSHQSDVWSLGITFWEIYSLGDVPYPGLSWTEEFVNLLKNNLRPSKPAKASDELYDIMLDCWKPSPDTRPTFEGVYKRLYEYQKQMNSLTK